MGSTFVVKTGLSNTKYEIDWIEYEDQIKKFLNEDQDPKQSKITSKLQDLCENEKLDILAFKKKNQQLRCFLMSIALTNKRIILCS
jgi:hypothetical protein